MFLNGTGEKRPFGNGIILDGVDFDVENGAKDADGYWVTLINELRNLTKADTSKHYFLSGAPQCVFPDEWSVPCACNTVSDILFILLGSDPALTRPLVMPILISYLYSSTTITVVFRPFLVYKYSMHSKQNRFLTEPKNVLPADTREERLLISY